MKENPNCVGFPPNINEQCKLIILGSMPSVASLNAGQYYAHPQNRFWPMMAAILEGKEAPRDYDGRIAMLMKHNIALWDAISTCDRDGSLDSAIKNERYTDISGLLEKFPSIKTILCNGNKSFACFKRGNKKILTRADIVVKAMPSTSPANAKWRLPMLIDVWSEAIKAGLQ